MKLFLQTIVSYLNNVFVHESEYNKIIFLKQKIACTFVSIHTRMHEKERAYDSLLFSTKMLFLQKMIFRLYLVTQ